MDIRQLKCFAVVAEEGNIGRAAARLYISQPPLTRRIQSLENELGVTLFNRTSWGVELTQAGESLLNHAQDIIAHIDLATEQTQLADKGLAGRVEIGICGYAMLNIIPQILRNFSEVCRGINVTLQFGSRERRVEALKQGRLLVDFDNSFPAQSELCVKRVYRDPIVVAVNKNNPLTKKSFIYPEDLYCEPLILEQNSHASSIANILFGNRGFEPVIVQNATDAISAITMVSCGLGCALVPESTQCFQPGNVVYKPFSCDVDAHVDLFCAYRKNESSPLLSAMFVAIDSYQGIGKFTAMNDQSQHAGYQ